LLLSCHKTIYEISSSLLLNSKLEQAIVLATSEEVPPLVVPQGVKFLSLVEGITPSEVLLATAV
jgi:hypothetical protein